MYCEVFIFCRDYAGEIINFILGALSNHRRACCKFSKDPPNGQISELLSLKKTTSRDRSKSIIILKWLHEHLLQGSSVQETSTQFKVTQL